MRITAFSPAHPCLLAATLLAGCGGSDESTGSTPTGPVATVTVTPGSQQFASLGVTATFTAQLRDAEGAVITGQSVVWSRRGSGATQVSGTGVVTAVANGVDTIVATASGRTGLAAVTVQQVPAALNLTASASTLTRLGATATVTGALRDANNQPFTGGTIVWTSANSAALPIDGTGKVTAARPGSSVVTATAGDVSATITLNVALSSPVGGPILGAAVACSGGAAGPFPCQGVNLMSFLPVSGVGAAGGNQLNDIWGWVDPATSREYVMVGRNDGIAFVDVTNPLDPTYLGFLPITPGAVANFWHDIKVYNDHAFIVADGAGPHGMQVFDLRILRSHVGVPRDFTANTVYRQINSAHNIFINEASGFAYIVGASGGGTTCGSGLHMVDIRIPTAPTFAGCFADVLTGRARTGYTHDVQCVIYSGPDAAHAGREICFGSNETAISIADVTNKSAPTALSRASYPQLGYTHQGWLTADQRYFLINDELDESGQGVTGTRTLVWDVTDLEDPILVTQFFGPNRAIDHNHYIRGNRMFASTYQFGLRVIDVSVPTAPSALGFFDTAPELPNTPGFGGSWSNYPFFPSGNIVVTSGNEGLFVLRVP